MSTPSRSPTARVFASFGLKAMPLTRLPPAAVSVSTPADRPLAEFRTSTWPAFSPWFSAEAARALPLGLNAIPCSPSESVRVTGAVADSTGPDADWLDADWLAAAGCPLADEATPGDAGGLPCVVRAGGRLAVSTTSTTGTTAAAAPAARAMGILRRDARARLSSGDDPGLGGIQPASLAGKIV